MAFNPGFFDIIDKGWIRVMGRVINRFYCAVIQNEFINKDEVIIERNFIQKYDIEFKKLTSSKFIEFKVITKEYY